MKKILVAMSGGTDSSVTALILKNKGFYIEGVTAIFHNNGSGLPSYVEKANRVCEKIGIKHRVLNFEEEFKEKVIGNFIKVYEEGKTPNPCILCNKTFKFGEILNYALNSNFTHIATGHYAKIIYSEQEKRWLLKKSNNVLKDQSYFLYFLTQTQLKHTLFPLEDHNKDEVKKIAVENGLFKQDEIKESQDICFVEGKKYSKFIKENGGFKGFLKGNFIDVNGKVLGQHNGIVNYTIGQRKGIGLSFREPMFVKEIDYVKNEIVLGKEEELFEKTLTAKNINLIKEETLKEPIICTAKVRYKQKEEKAKAWQPNQNTLKVEFEKSQRAIAKGQAVVLYDEEGFVLGGGEIF